MCLSTEAAYRLHEDLARVMTNLNKNKLKDLHAGLLQIPKAKLKMRGAPPWESRGGVLPRIIQRREEGGFSSINLGNKDSPFSRPAFCTYKLACHMCGQLKEVARLTLINKAQWVPLFCGTCGLSRKACKWLCPCKKPWHTCIYHRAGGFQCRRPIGTAKKSFSTTNREHHWPLGSYFPNEAKKRAYSQRCDREHSMNIISAKRQTLHDRFLNILGGEAHKNINRDGDPGTSGGTEDFIQKPPLSLGCSQPVKNHRRGRGILKQGEASPKKRRKAKPPDAGQAKGPRLAASNRSLPVAWGRDIFLKVPKLADQFSNISKAPGVSRKRLYGKQPDTNLRPQSDLPRPPE